MGVTGGIAAYKAAALASALVKQHCHVEVILTEHATQFITPLTFEQLTGNRAMVDTFDRNFSHQVEHIALARRTDLVLVAPATANVCAKLAHGLADDMLTTTILACRCPKLIAPAMNTGMFENPVTQDNLELLRKYGWEVIAPASGRLACGDVGAGKLPGPTRSFSTFCASWPSPTIWRGSGYWSPSAPPRSRWTRCATSPTTPPGKWAMPSPGWPCSGGPGHPHLRPHRPDAPSLRGGGPRGLRPGYV